jgi:hypothetical protein
MGHRQACVLGERNDLLDLVQAQLVGEAAEALSTAQVGLLAQALHSGDPAFDELPAYFRARFGPALTPLLRAASDADEIHTDVSADELLYAVARLCRPIGDGGPDQGHRLVGLLINGLRYRSLVT